MDIRKIFDEANTPCYKCPYKSGYIKTFVSPCIECKMSDYKKYKYFSDIFSRDNQEKTQQ